MGQDLIVLKVDKARALLAEASTPGDAKKVADLAKAAEVYARRQKLSEEAIAYATAVKVDALTLMGEFLRATPKNNGAAAGGKKAGPRGSYTEPRDTRPTLAEAGIGKKESAAAQRLAAVKEAAPDLHAKVRAGKVSVSQAVVEVRREEKREELNRKAAAAPDPDPDACRVVTGDCIDGLANLRAGSVRLAFADPPYNIGFDYGQGAKADLLPRGQYLDWCCRWMAAAARVLAPDGSLWVLINDESAAEFKLNLEGAGLHLRQWLVWYESFGVNCAGQFNRTHRHLLWCVKDRKRFVFHETAVLRPSDREAKYGDRRAQPGGKVWDSVWGINPPVPRLTGTCAERLPDFPTQLPLALLTPIVACASDPGDLTLDLFAGSGSLGEAALRQGRRFLGYELNDVYAEKARLRLRAATKE